MSTGLKAVLRFLQVPAIPLHVSANRTLVANFSLSSYTIGLSALPPAGGSVTGGGIFTSGTSITVTATPAAGYSFVNWTEGGTQVSSSASYTFTVSANRTLVANFSLNSYTIGLSALPPAGGSVTGGGIFTSGTSITVTATPAAGYSFVNWTEGGTQVSSSASYTFTVSANRTLVANFSLNSYTIGLSALPPAGGSVTGGGIFTSGTSITVTATPAAGYSFVNWTEGGTQVSSSASYTFTVSANRTLVANFSLNSYTIGLSALPPAGGSVTGGGIFTSGTSITVTATPAAGYSFVNWTEGGTQVSSSASYTFTVSANRTLVANFSLNSYTIGLSALPPAGGSVTGGGIFTSGTSITVTATPAAGYSFVNWTEGGTQVSSSASYTFTVSANRTLVANFSLNSYTIGLSALPPAGGSVTGGGIFTSGTSITVTATPAAGYSFVNWTEGGTQVSSSASYTFTVSANRTLVANFSLNSYTIGLSALPPAGGSVTGGGIFTSGTSITVTATPAAGYSFVNWTEGGTQVSSSASYTFTVSANRTLVANFSLNSYTIGLSALPPAGGSVTGGGIFTSGTSITVTATPAAGYSFVNWTEGGTQVSSSASYTFTVSANRTLVANFSLNTYTVTTSSSPAGGGTTSGGGSFNSGTSVTVTATANTGYTFVNWTEGVTSVSTSASYTFTITANRTLVANFNPITYTITTSSSPTDGGTTNGGGTYNYGASATVTATPATGYQFVNWTQAGSAVSINASYTFPVSTNRTLVANFSLISYSVTTSSNPTAGGTTSGGGTYNFGTSVTLSATPSAGYAFVNWTEGGTPVSTSASYNFNISASRTLVANFSLNTFTVVTSSNPTAGGSTSGGGTYNYGASATVTATPATGYQFVNWVEGGTAVSTSANYTFTVSANRTLVANFSLITFTVATSLSPAGGGTANGAGSYGYGTSVTVSSTTNTGYTFVNWTEGGTVVSSSASYTFTLNANRTLVANFSLNTYAVVISSSPTTGGTTSGGGTFNYGTSVTVSATPSTGYTFVNWTESGTVVSANTSHSFTLSTDRTFVANFSLQTYTVTTTSSPTAGGTASGGGIYNYGASAIVTATPETGYQFVNWTEGGAAVSTNASYTFTVNASRTLLANFSLVNYTVSTSSSPAAGGSTSGAGTYSYGTSATITATPTAGYLFANWTEGGTVVSTNNSYAFTVTGNRAIVANFSLITHSVSTSSSPSAGGTTSGGGTYNPGISVTVTATPASGYQFLNWTEGGIAVSTNPSYTFLVYAGRTLVATFQSINFITIIALSNPGGGGTTTGAGTYTASSIISVTATQATGYQFVNWTEDGSVVSTNASYTFTVTSGRTLVANFNQIMYTVSTSSSPAAGGSASGGGTYSSGSSATVTANPATGYQFINWSLGGSPVSTSASYSFTVTSNLTLVGNFTQATYTITTSSSPSAGGTTTGGGGFNYGASATVTAVPTSGYLFVNWTEGGSSVSTNASYTFTVSDNRSLMANFNQIPKILNLTDANGKALHNNDIIRIDNSDAGSFSIKVESNAEWTVSESCLWFKAVKESSTSIKVTYMENISVIEKTASMKVLTALNAEIQINVQQKARVSQLNVSKFETIRLYPNPANDFAYLYFGEEFPGKIRITVASIQGLVVQTKELNDIEPNQIIDLDVARLQSGQYLVKVSGKTSQKVFYMIKY